MKYFAFAVAAFVGTFVGLATKDYRWGIVAFVLVLYLVDVINNLASIATEVKKGRKLLQDIMDEFSSPGAGDKDHEHKED